MELEEIMSKLNSEEKMFVSSLIDKDPLTGLYNRRKFDQDIREELNKAIRYVRNLSLLMVDIDYFKKYNDLHGHQRGDAILRKIGTLFNSNMRSTDKAYRYGGEEFAIICTETDRDSAIIFAERLRKVISKEKFNGEYIQ